jgi:Tol biopolymer transport system component
MPRWSPDSRIVFASDRDGGFELFIASIDGGPPVRLTGRE